MEEKKIAETINIRINLGNFNHIDITKYAEKKITYETKEEMVQKEDELTDELLVNIIRNMRTIPEKLGKKTNAIAEVEDRIVVGIEKSEVVNPALKIHDKKIAEQKEEQIVQEAVIKEMAVSDNELASSKVEEKVEEKTISVDKVEAEKIEKNDFFGDDELF